MEEFAKRNLILCNCNCNPCWIFFLQLQRPRNTFVISHPSHLFGHTAKIKIPKQMKAGLKVVAAPRFVEILSSSIATVASIPVAMRNALLSTTY